MTKQQRLNYLMNRAYTFERRRIAYAKPAPYGYRHVGRPQAKSTIHWAEVVELAFWLAAMAATFAIALFQQAGISL